MRYQVKERMDFIKAHILKHGTFNRSDLKKKFGITRSTIIRDLAQFHELYPGLIRYDAKRKCYVLKETTKC